MFSGKPKTKKPDFFSPWHKSKTALQNQHDQTKTIMNQPIPHPPALQEDSNNGVTSTKTTP